MKNSQGYFTDNQINILNDRRIYFRPKVFDDIHYNLRLKLTWLATRRKVLVPNGMFPKRRDVFKEWNVIANNYLLESRCDFTTLPADQMSTPGKYR